MSVVTTTAPVAQSAEEEAIDCLYQLPLSLVPIQTPGLRRALLTKNARLDSVIQMFNDAHCGRGQVFAHELGGFFQGHEASLEADRELLTALTSLESFDIYTLRIELRRLDIGFENFDRLQLSAKKKEELTSYMRTFTRPLIQRIYGTDTDSISDMSQLIGMLANPDRKKAIAELNKMATDLDISITEVPSFLERYGDIFLSLSYFRHCLDQITNDIFAFIKWMEEVEKRDSVMRDPANKRLIEEVKQDLEGISTSIVGRFEYFNHRSHSFWDNINAETFREFRNLVTAHHVSIGAVLCGLAVKMQMWHQRFPQGGGAPPSRVEFIRTEIYPGLGRIKKLEAGGKI